MSITLNLDGTDDPTFVALIERVIAKLIRRNRPTDVSVVEIKNWFDHKWLNYSGRTVVAFPERGADLPRTGHCRIESALDDSYQEKTTFPPFTPNRIISQRLWSCDTSMKHGWVHREWRQHSSENLHRRVADFSESALYFWYSSGTAANRKGSLMVYRADHGEVDTWYASLHKKSEWKLGKAKGISTEAFNSLLTNDAEQVEDGDARLDSR